MQLTPPSRMTVVQASLLARRRLVIELQFRSSRNSIISADPVESVRSAVHDIKVRLCELKSLAASAEDQQQEQQIANEL
eukprot:1145197-Pleurochrysis_carterae.AAC.1